MQPLKTRLVPVEDWLIRAVRYDREKRILEVHLHALLQIAMHNFDGVISPVIIT